MKKQCFKKQILQPKPLEKGGTIGLALPASFLPLESIEWIIKALHQLGYQTKLGSNASSKHGYLAGKDPERAQAFMDLWLDPEVSMLWCLRGGYGSGRLLSYLDYHEMQKHPKLLMGMSDITALHLAIGQMLPCISYLGPNLPTLFPLSKPTNSLTLEHCLHFLSHPLKDYTYTYPDPYELSVIREGVAEGLAVGGNLAVLASLLGTPWQLEAEGKILILEDINEPPYKIDRMLNQLNLSGILDKVSGVILGTFEKCVSAHPENALSLETIFEEYFQERGYPVVRGFPTGHIEEERILPLQYNIKLDTTSKAVALKEKTLECSAMTD